MIWETFFKWKTNLNLIGYQVQSQSYDYEYNLQSNFLLIVSKSAEIFPVFEI